MDRERLWKEGRKGTGVAEIIGINFRGQGNPVGASWESGSIIRSQGSILTFNGDCEVERNCNPILLVSLIILINLTFSFCCLSAILINYCNHLSLPL